MSVRLTVHTPSVQPCVVVVCLAIFLVAGGVVGLVSSFSARIFPYLLQTYVVHHICLKCLGMLWFHFGLCNLTTMASSSPIDGPRLQHPCFTIFLATSAIVFLATHLIRSSPHRLCLLSPCGCLAPLGCVFPYLTLRSGMFLLFSLGLSCFFI